VSGKHPMNEILQNISFFCVLDAFGSIYQGDEMNNFSDELMAELGRDEKTLEKLGSQDLTPNEVNRIFLYLKYFGLIFRQEQL
jgi:hypothetical protein